MHISYEYFLPKEFKLRSSGSFSTFSSVKLWAGGVCRYLSLYLCPFPMIKIALTLIYLIVNTKAHLTLFLIWTLTYHNFVYNMISLLIFLLGYQPPRRLGNKEHDRKEKNSNARLHLSKHPPMLNKVGHSWENHNSCQEKFLMMNNGRKFIL